MLYFLSTLFVLIVSSIFYAFMSMKIIGDDSVLLAKRKKSNVLKTYKKGFHFLPVFFFQTVAVVSLELRCLKRNIYFSCNSKNTINKNVYYSIYYRVIDPVAFFQHKDIVNDLLEDAFLKGGSDSLDSVFNFKISIPKANQLLKNENVGVEIEFVNTVELATIEI